MPADYAKLTRPQPQNVFVRNRLHTLFDGASKDCPVVWVDAPPGYGKTVALATWLETGQAPSFWFRIDGSDRDPSTFFSWLEMAAKPWLPNASSLPKPTAATSDLNAFARGFFRKLFSLLPNHFVMVFDDCHTLDEGPVPQMFLTGLEEIPGHIHVFVASRDVPPPGLSVFKVRQQMRRVGWDVLRLSEEETIEIATMKGHRSDADALRKLHVQTEGWAAGLALMMEGRDLTQPNFHDKQELFNYLLTVRFEGLGEERQVFLMRSASLPKMALETVAKLTGHANPRQEFIWLERHNFFVTRVAADVWQYHCLFREFLLEQARSTFPPSQLKQLRQDAALLLANAGEIDDAANLLIEAEAPNLLENLILRHAEALLCQVRHYALARWIDARIKMGGANSPWLEYWHGECLLPYDQAVARGHLESAYQKFADGGDTLGCYRAWCSIVDTFVFGFDGYTPLDYWIAEGEQLYSSHPPPSGQLDVRFANAMFVALMYRQPEYERIVPWEEKVLHSVMCGSNLDVRVGVGSQLLLYETWWLCDMDKARSIVDTLSPSLSGHANPLTRITWGTMACSYYWLNGEYAECQRLAEESLRIAWDSGIHTWDILLHCQALFPLLSLEDRPGIEQRIELLQALQEQARPMERASYHFLAAWGRLLSGEIGQALQHLQIAVEKSAEAGSPFMRIHAMNMYGRALFRKGERRRGREVVETALKQGEFLRNNSIEYLCQLSVADFARIDGNNPACLEALKKALAIGSKCGIRTHCYWETNMMVELYAIALRHGIEISHVQSMIVRHGMACPDKYVWLEHWPGKNVKIRTFGKLRIFKRTDHGDEPIYDYSSDGSSKPMDLLVYLLATGPDGVSSKRLQNCLWPDCDSDRVNNYHQTLMRLREMIGRNAVIQKNKRVSVDLRLCWIDCWAWERDCHDVPDIEKLPGLFLQSYGDGEENFDDEYILMRREKLRNIVNQRLSARQS